MNTYHVIGLMSGTSLDGVDLAYCLFTYEKENWIYKILNTATFPYSIAWEQKLAGLMDTTALQLIATDHAYGQYLGELVKKFVIQNNLTTDFISSHGHTIFHQPQNHISLQLGHGAYLAAAAGLPVVCDFRTLDIALGGQGAPLVPIGDKYLFPSYDFCLNLGGIANISFETNHNRVAYDICACNMLLNTLANQLGQPYDNNGQIASTGTLNTALLNQLNSPAFFSAPYPKSLGKEWADAHTLKDLLAANIPIADKLHTACKHIAIQIFNAVNINNYPENTTKIKILLTGGGALNNFLVSVIRQELGPAYEVVVPDDQLINFKEALIFAFLGVLRWRQEPNCLSSVTGAKFNNVGGAIYWG